ncbi:MAG: cysteine--tRNA ligase, partial [bacterium]|nr:cysteine--tRNA ligase [bacterium]
DAINDDLNLPQAIAVLWDTVKSPDLKPAQKLALIGDYDRVLGLNLLDGKKDSGLPAEVEQLLQKRKEARAAKDWAGSDAIRGQILALGYVVEDGKGGQTVRGKKFGE